MTYFNAEKLPEPRREFVLWLDCMGTHCFMQRSIKTAANFIFKFQNIVASVCSDFKGVNVYPVMDGVYITSKDSRDILNIAKQVMKSMSELFSSTVNVLFRFMVRGAIAYGDVYHGASVPKEAFVQDGQSVETVYIRKNTILLGVPVIQANLKEKSAPPFGIALHNSCKLDPKRDSHFDHEWFVWNNDISDEIINQLKEKVDEYFEEYSKQTAYSGYTQEKIDAHRKAFEQYTDLMQTISRAH